MNIHHPGIKNLSFSFENCDSAEISVSFIGLFYVKNIQLSLGKLPCINCKTMEIDYHKTCDSFMISLYRGYNEAWKNGGGIDHSFNHYEDLFERLKCNDIVTVGIKKSNDVHENIRVPFDGEYKNKYQQTVTNKFGDIFIFISKDPNEFEDFLNIIDDDYYMNEMFDIEELEKYLAGFKR